MGRAIGEQLSSKYQIYVFDKDKNKTANLTNINITDNVINLMSQVDIVILAIKPQDFDLALNEIRTYSRDKLIISIAAGITTDYIEKRLDRARVIRVMPNLPAKIGKGMICLCPGKSATQEDLNMTKHLFKNLGETLVLKEDMMNAATAISGSGPGYYFDIVESHQDDYKNNPDKLLKDFISSLIRAAESIGFSHKEATLLGITTGNASDYLLVKTKLSPAELKKQVVSKGGTTEAALEVLHRTGSLEESVKAALRRAEELSKKE